VSGLQARDIGHRVVVRYRLSDDPDGHRFTDVLGVLQSLDAETLVVRRADASAQLVPHDQVVAAKTIPAVPLRRVDLDQLLLTTALGRPAVETERLGDWLLRASGGWTGRGNSLLPYGDPGVPLDEAVARTIDFYRTRELPPLALTVLGSPMDRELRDRGWIDARPNQGDTLVLHTSLDQINAEPRYDVQVAGRPDEEWYAVRFDGEPPAVARTVMEGAPVAGFASIHLDGRIVAVGRGSMTGHWLGVDGVEVADAYRRRGLATALLRGLARWAGAHGARRSYLEVAEDNVPALTTYRSLAYAEAYRYRYLTHP